MSVLYASKKYLVSGLTSRCEKFLQDQLNATNAAMLLAQSIFFDAKALEEQCMAIIQRQTQKVFASEAFLNSCDEVVRRILASDYLTVSEIQVFDACVAWAQVKCQKQGISKAPAALKDALGDLLYLIRFSNNEAT